MFAEALRAAREAEGWEVKALEILEEKYFADTDFIEEEKAGRFSGTSCDGL